MARRMVAHFVLMGEFKQNSFDIFLGLLSCDISGCYGIMHGATSGFLEKFMRDVWLTRNHYWASNNCSE